MGRQYRVMLGGIIGPPFTKTLAVEKWNADSSDEHWMGLFISDELFHFVGRRHPLDHESNYSILKLVLSKRCVSHRPHSSDWGTVRTTTNWEESLITGELIVPTVTCFCDIPFEHLPVHLLKYGSFGLAFRKDFLIRYGARPVTYVPLRNDDHLSVHGRTLLRDIEQIYRGFRAQLIEPATLQANRGRALGAQPTSPEDTLSALDSLLTRDFLAFIKPYNSQLPENDPSYYYSEREWRKFGNLMFPPSEVARVIVVEGYVARVETEFPEYQGKVDVAST